MVQWLPAKFVLSGVRLSATAWTVAHQAPLSVGFLRQEYWSGLPFPSPLQGIFLTQGSNPHLLCRQILSHRATWEAHFTQHRLIHAVAL